MPIIGWSCPICQRNMPLDHYAVSECGLAIHPDYALAVLRSDDDYYGTDKLTVTVGLGCPRSRALEARHPVYVNPLDYNALILGKAWDVALEKHAEDGTAKIRVRGVVEGIALEGEIDRIRWLGNDLLIEDHKHSNNFQYKYLKAEDGPRYEYVLQTSLYAELYAQTFGERPTRGVVWYNFSGGNSGSSPPLMAKVYQFVDARTALDHKPYGGSYTVRELYQQGADFLAGKIAPADLPLVGKTMAFGSKEFCDYCQVQQECLRAAGGAPF